MMSGSSNALSRILLNTAPKTLTLLHKKTAKIVIFHINSNIKSKLFIQYWQNRDLW